MDNDIKSDVEVNFTITVSSTVYVGYFSLWESCVHVCSHDRVGTQDAHVSRAIILWFRYFQVIRYKQQQRYFATFCISHALTLVTDVGVNSLSYVHTRSCTVLKHERFFNTPREQKETNHWGHENQNRHLLVRLLFFIVFIINKRSCHTSPTPLAPSPLPHMSTPPPSPPYSPHPCRPGERETRAFS